MDKNEIRNIISRMMEVLGVEGLPQLAKILDTTRPNIDNWVKRGGVPKNNLFRASQLSGCDIEWLKTGVGEKPIRDEYHAMTKNLRQQIEVLEKHNDLLKEENRLLRDEIAQASVKLKYDEIQGVSEQSDTVH